MTTFAHEEETPVQKLKDQVAVVTGGSRGIGRGIAEAFLDQGARVVISGRDPAKGQQALDELKMPDRVHFVAGDVRVKDDVERTVDQAVERFGRLDILVNNAGGSDGFAMVHELSDEAWNNALDWNLNAVFWATRRALQHMLPQQSGRIMCISSVEGKQASKPMVSHYITNKHAIHGFVKAVAHEYGPLGITSNAICPGAVETDLMRGPGREAATASGMTYDEFLEMYAAESAIKRLNTVEEVAAMAVLLASEEGGGITGALLNVDGGTASW